MTDPETSAFDTGIIEDAARARSAGERRRARQAIAISAGVTVAWLVYVTVVGHWGRVIDHWGAAVTMVFGSFVAGSTPQGGGAVAFPVFTKVLDVPTDVARSFSLCIQTVGMGTAALAILVTRRRIEWRAVGIGIPLAVAGFLVGLYVLGDSSRPFWPSRLPGPYVKVTFTIVLAAMAFVVYLGSRVLIRKLESGLPPMNTRLRIALVTAGFLGGIASALVGSGADVFIFLFVVVLFGVDPRIGVPSSVLVMAAISVMGFVVLGIADGQLAIDLSGGSESVVAVGGDPVAVSSGDPVFGTGTPLPADRFDLFGLWIAAFPVVAWGAPLGSWAASRMTSRGLVAFAISLSVAELVSTAVFLDDLHALGGLTAYALVGLATALAGLYFLARYRRHIFRLPGLSTDETLTRGHLDVVPGYQRQLGVERDDRGSVDESEEASR